MVDPTKVFYIIQVLKGYGKLGFRIDSRLPITLPILTRLLMAAPHCTGTSYDQYRFQAMCGLAFFAFLRIGEITATSKQSPIPLCLNQLTKLLRGGDHEVIGFKLTFTDYKHHYNQRPFSMVIYCQPSHRPCPVKLLCRYLACRGNSAGPIFITAAGAAVSRNMFAKQLNDCLKFCDLNPYKSHSFRIGAASFAAEHGVSDAQIRILGRWKSNAFHKYIRVQTLATT